VRGSPKKRRRIETLEGGGGAPGPHASAAACIRGGVSLSKHQWEVREKAVAPKVSLKDDIHYIIGRLASPTILEEAIANTRALLKVPLPSSGSEPIDSLGSLNSFARHLQEVKSTGFLLTFQGIIILIEIVRLTQRYAIESYVHTLHL
jgi:hypothetical protein